MRSTDESDLVEVDAENGVFHRLERLLAHLETLAPDEDWSRYRNASGAVRWNRVLVSGHSQGAGHAAFIARLHRVARAVLFSGTEPAPWTQAGDFATPGADFFGLAHFLEPIYPPIQASWDNIGIPGNPTSVDGVSAPYGGSHQLGTAREDCTGDPESNGFYHNCHCVDGWMPPPLLDGTPAFQPAWDHLFAPEPAMVPAIGSSGTVVLAAMLVALAARQIRRAGSG